MKPEDLRFVLSALLLPLLFESIPSWTLNAILVFFVPTFSDPGLETQRIIINTCKLRTLAS